MSLGRYLTAEDVREIHLALFEDHSSEYLRSGPQGGRSRRDTLQLIRNVKDSKIRRNIEAVTGITRGNLPAAWSHHMAVNAGTHLWPDANHRTAAITFGLALARAFDSYYDIPPAQAARLVHESKSLRDADYLRRSRYYTVLELSEPAHPYRHLFASFEGWLSFGPE